MPAAMRRWFVGRRDARTAVLNLNGVSSVKPKPNDPELPADLAALPEVYRELPASVLIGLEEFRRGEAVSRGSFAQYAEEEE